MWVCVRRPSGNRRPSAFSYKSYLFFSLALIKASEPNPAAEPDCRRVSYGTCSTYSWTHTCKQRVRFTKGRSNPQFSYMTSAGAFQNLAWWLTNTGLSAQWKGWCSKIHFCHHSLTLMLFQTFTACFLQKKTKGNGRVNVWEAVFHEWLVIYKATTDKKKHNKH